MVAQDQGILVPNDDAVATIHNDEDSKLNDANMDPIEDEVDPLVHALAESTVVQNEKGVAPSDESWLASVRKAVKQRPNTFRTQVHSISLGPTKKTKKRRRQQKR